MKILKSAYPHIIALIVFAAISAMFFAPQYAGEALRQGDMIQASGMAQDIKEQIASGDEHPQWAGRMFGGMPAYMIDMNYDGRWIKSMADCVYFLGQPAAFLFVAMSCFYLMLLMFGVNPWLGIIGGIAYGMSTYFPIIIGAGHITKMMALAWIPGVVGAVYYAYNRRWVLGAALAGVFLAIEISTAHQQIPYYFGFVILAMVINEFVKNMRAKTLPRFAKVTVALLGAAVLAVGANFVQLYYQASYAPQTIRGKSELTAAATDNAHNHTSGLDKDYATAWSYGKAETFNLFIPNFVGGGRDFSTDGSVSQVLGKYQAPKEYATYLPSYFGSQPFTEGPVYLGAVMVFLMVLGMFLLRGAAKWWIAGVSVLAIMLAWGSNMMWLTDLFLDYFPLYNKFRTVSMILVVVQWSVPLLAVLALNEIAKGEVSKEKFLKSLYYSVGITAGFALLAAFVLEGMMDLSAPGDAAIIARSFGLNPQDPNAKILIDDISAGMVAERSSMLSTDALRSMLFILLTGGIVWLYYFKKIRLMLMVGAVAILVTVDLYGVDRRYISKEDFQPKAQAMAIMATAADEQILADTSDYRVANFTVDPFKDATTSYFHRSVGGYHAAKLRRYHDIIDRHLLTNNEAVYDMLNTKYIIAADGVHERSSAAGSAWFVPTIEWVGSADEEIAALDPGFDPRRVAVVDERFRTLLGQVNLVADSTARISLTSYKVNELEYQYTAAQSGVVVFSEIYYPDGWKAYVDGVEAEYFRADYILRAMVVPAGSHAIEWRFAAPGFETMVWITRLSSLLLILMALGSMTFAIIKTVRRDGK